MSSLTAEIDLRIQPACSFPSLLAYRVEKMLENAGVQGRNAGSDSGETGNVLSYFSPSERRGSKNSTSEPV